MYRIFTVLFTASMLFATNCILAQNVLVNYPLTANGAPAVVDANLSATNFISTAAASLSFTSNGAFTSSWTTSGSPNTSEYFEISFTVDANFEANISDFNYGYRRSGTGPLNFELRYTLDGTYANSVLLDDVVIPDVTSNFVGSLSGLDIDVTAGQTITFRWYPYNAEDSGGTLRIDVNSTDLEVLGTVEYTGTSVFFESAAATVDEGDGTYNLNVAINNPDVVATAADVVLVSGNSALVNGFTSQTVNFPSNDGSTQTVTLTITDDANCSGLQDLVFEIQDVIDGDNAIAVNPDEFTLTIVDNDQTAESAYNNDFEQNNLNGWVQNDTDHWASSSTGAINGTYSMKHNFTASGGESYATVPLNNLDLNNGTTTWRFQMKNGNWDPSSNNRFWVYLACNSTTLWPNSSSGGGYTVGVNQTGTTDLLRLSRVDVGGSVTTLVESSFDWDADDIVGIEVTRDINGEWTLRFDDNGGFDNLASAGSATDLTFTTAPYLGVVLDFSIAFAGEFWVDDFSINQDVCSNTYYSQSSGNFTDDIWDTTPVGTAGAAEINRYNSFVIQNGHTVTLDNDVEVRDSEIETGGTLNLGSTGNTLALTGDWTNNGSFDAGNGTVQFFGSDADINGSSAFWNLDINAPNSTITLNGNTDLWGTLTLGEGDLDVNGNTFTLKSDDTNSAAVGTVTNGSVNGNVVVERYIQNGVTSWRNMGASVSGATLADWNIHFTTSGFPGSDFPNWPSPTNRFISLKSYDETELGDREIGWKSPTNITNVVGDGQGFWMYVAGSELPATVDVTGSLITGEQTLNLDYTPDLGAVNDGWNLISNMYAATIDWDSPDFTRTGLEDGIWIWNQDVQQYGSYIDGIGLHNVNNEIAHSQSFWVHAEAASPTITFREEIKSNNNNADWIKTNNGSNPGIVRLRLTGNGYHDETVLAFKEASTVGYEGTFDAMKFYSNQGGVPNLATVAQLAGEDIDLGINSVPMPETTGSLSIPLRTVAGEAGDYTLSIHSVENVSPSTCLYVEDLLTGDLMAIEEGEQMTIALDTGMVEARFLIHVTAPISVEKEDNICHSAEEGVIVALGTGNGPWTYTWTNEAGEQLKVSENIYTADTLSSLGAGQYFVEVSGGNSVCGLRSEAIMIFEPVPSEANYIAEAPACNEGTDGSLLVNLNGGQGQWNVSLIGSSTEETLAIDTDGMLAFDNLASGNYTLFATDDCGTIEQSINVFDENVVIADFELVSEEITLQSGATVTPLNNSSNAILHHWDMGDGSDYFLSDVSHTYNAPGEYTITLHGVNDYCEDMTSKIITVTDLSVNIAENTEDVIQVWFDGSEVVIEHAHDGQQMDLQVMNILGKTMMTTQSFSSRTTLNVINKGFATGVYFVHISLGEEVITHKFVINK